jgi:hypothetical protein
LLFAGTKDKDAGEFMYVIEVGGLHGIVNPMLPVTSAHAVVVVYSITDARTFERAEAIVSDVRKINLNIPIALFATKKDLEETSRDARITEQRVLDLYEERSLCSVVETSAATGENVARAFAEVASAIADAAAVAAVDKGCDDGPRANRAGITSGGRGQIPRQSDVAKLSAAMIDGRGYTCFNAQSLSSFKKPGCFC